MHVKFRDKTKETTTLKSHYTCKKKHSDQLIPNPKHHLLTVYFFKNKMFIPLNLNHNTCAAINHLLDIPQMQTCHYRTYPMVFTASKVWNDILKLVSAICFHQVIEPQKLLKMFFISS